MTITEMSRLLAETLSNELGYQEEKTDVMRYGFEMILGESMKLIALVLLAALLQVLPELLVLYLVSALFRLTAGGAHNQTYHGCFVVTVSVYVIFSWTSHLLGSVLSPWLLSLFLYSSGCIALFSFARWAPVEHHNRPLDEESKRLRRRLSLTALFIWLAATIFLLHTAPLTPPNKSLILTSITAVLLQSLFLSPLGFKAIGLVDSILK